MRLVHLKGANPGTARSLESADFEKMGVEQDNVVWEDANNHTVELKNAVADALINQLGDEFEITSESEEETDDQSSSE